MNRRKPRSEPRVNVRLESHSKSRSNSRSSSGSDKARAETRRRWWARRQARVANVPASNRRRKTIAPADSTPVAVETESHVRTGDDANQLRKSGRTAALRRTLARLRQPALMTGKLIALVAAAAVLVVIAQQIETYVRSADTFATKSIEVQGQERLSEAELLDISGLALAQNVFAVSPEDAQARLLSNPWIAEASVERRLPGTYMMRVRERRPVALLLIDSLYLVDDGGSVFKRLDSSDGIDLPLITGLNRGRFTSDAAYRASMLVEVVALMHDYRGAGLWRREPISEVHVEDNDGLSLFIGSDAEYVRLGGGPFRGKLRRLRRVLDRLQGEELRADYIYVDNVRRPDRVTVKLRELPPPLLADASDISQN